MGAKISGRKMDKFTAAVALSAREDYETARLVLQNAGYLIRHALGGGDRVKWHGLGTFHETTLSPSMSAQRLRDPRTKDPVTPRKAIYHRFRPAADVPPPKEPS